MRSLSARQVKRCRSSTIQHEGHSTVACGSNGPQPGGLGWIDTRGARRGR
jgi:hypothetical protein